MKVKKILLLIIIIVLIIIIGISVIVVIKINNKEDTTIPIYVEGTEEKEKTQKIQPKTIDEAKYYMVTNLVRKYYNLLDASRYTNRDGENFANEESVRQNIYNLLSKEYIQEYNITVDNIYNHIQLLKNAKRFIPIDIQVNEGIKTEKYLVSGLVVDMNNRDEEYSKVNLFVSIDNKNNTFSIEPISNKVNIDQIKIQNNEIEVEKNNVNAFNYNAPTEEELSKEKIINLRELLLVKSKELYNMFDEEYRNKKFGSYEGYTQYVDKNYQKLMTTTLKQFNVTQENGYTQYVCIDNYGKYYIFRNANANDMTILLDTYTVDLPEFLTKYKKAKDQEKVGMNIEKFISAINDKDYKFAYNLLDEVFRKNNLPTQEYFENYVKNYMYENNTVEHKKVEKQGDTYVYELKLKNLENETEQKDLTVIMKLKEETNFVMSFSIE